MEKLISAGGSLVIGIFIPIYRKIKEYKKDKKKDKSNVEIFKSLNENKNSMEKNLIPLIELFISRSSTDFDLILSTYNSGKLEELVEEIQKNMKDLKISENLKDEYKNEINQRKKELQNLIEKRTNEFMPGNNISNLYLLNKQIIYIIINKLLGVKNLNKKLQDIIYDLINNYLGYITKNFENYYIKNVGNSNVLINKIREEIRKKEELGEDQDVETILFSYMLDNIFSNKNQKNDNKNNIYIIENDFMDKVAHLYWDAVIKKASYFIDNKINERISALLIQKIN